MRIIKGAAEVALYKENILWTEPEQPINVCLTLANRSSYSKKQIFMSEISELLEKT